MMLRRMEPRRSDGARRSVQRFRDWAAERTGFPSEVAEMALAHTVSDKTVAAYKRTDLLKRQAP